MKKRLLIPLLAFPLLLTQCHWFKKDNAKPIDQLPPATQEGKGTFGCLVNGRPYLPEGRASTFSNTSMSYDPTFQGGALGVTTFRQKEGVFQSIGIGSDSLTGTGTYILDARQGSIQYYDRNAAPCDYEYPTLSYGQGTLTITKFQLPVISGTFEFTLAKPGCDTIKVTEGRFDLKL